MLGPEAESAIKSAGFNLNEEDEGQPVGEVDLTYQGLSNETALILAVQVGDLMKVRQILSKGLDEKARSRLVLQHLKGQSEYGVKPAEEETPNTASKNDVRSCSRVPNDRLLCTDEEGVPRGACKSCSKCESFAINRAAAKAIPLLAEEVDAQEVAAKRMAKLGIVGKTPCQGCGCLSADHENLKSWMDKVRRRLWRFRASGYNTSRKVPRWSTVPAALYHNDPTEVALYMLTEGRRCWQGLTLD